MSAEQPLPVFLFGSTQLTRQKTLSLAPVKLHCHEKTDVRRTVKAKKPLIFPVC